MEQIGEASAANLLEASAGAGRAAATMLDLIDIRHHYGPVVAVDGVSLKIQAGEIVCLVGPSGCGKSTLLRVAAGLEDLEEGEVRVGGRTVATPGRSMPPERRGVGLVFQDYALFPHLTVFDNVRFGLSGGTGAAQRRRAMDTLAQVGMTDFAQAFPHALSGGQQQRVALARALAPRPPVLLLDEPFSGLDAGLRSQIRDETLHVLKENGAATMIVTHDPEEAMFLADRIALMRDGRIVQEGIPTDIYCRPETGFAAGFFGEVNRLRGRVEDGGIQTPIGRLEADGVAEGTDVEVLIRPEGLLLAHPIPGRGDMLGHVKAARLLGRSSLIHLSVPAGADHPVHLHARMPGQFLPPDDTFVAISLDRRQVFVFPQETG